ncbi:thiamine diphosphate-binding protein [Eremomyces bilateralis CBS 781.70]|uniref:Thiamine diphosphate-binding protein n=1 Tax=Eremomyces bilateralis CBS 781.70 TaxID=1392243 RepID=A0A6G1GGI1_9PEZI|nr:thiamine diphosphate-binding protein [Eremomyces bilateralis CBS 781.70]KAF1817036.1 thiamine diphosphate-binding protein [Eremomyces bilateralis CBS 781.70]
MAGFTLEHPSTRELTGGDLLAQCLKHMGVEVAFGLHGGHLDAFLMGCESIGIKLIDTRHETVAVQAAEGYSKIRDTIGVCFVTANSGYSNGLPGLATAYADRSPILCITSSPPLRDAENNSLQGQIDQVVVARPLTKFAHRVTHAEDAPRLVSHAIRTALAGAPGPVLLDFPIDVLFSPVTERLISWGSITSPLSYAPGPHAKAVEDTLALLKAAKRPVIITGTGGRSKEAGEALMKLAKTCGIPLFHSQKYLATVPADFELLGTHAGLLGVLPLLKKEQPDLALLLGVRTGMFLGGKSGGIIPNEGCKIVHVDVDSGEIGRTLPTDLGVTSDVTQMANALNASLESGFQGSVDASWVQAALSVKSLPSPFDTAPEEQSPGRIHPYHALKKVYSSIEPGCIIINDGGECGAWSNGLAATSKPFAVMSACGYLGFLGNGFGYSLGCAIAAPDRKIINIQGDGSAGFHFMELDTYKRFNLNIMTIVVNNFCWGMSSNGQELIYGTKNPARPVSDLSPTTEYETVAKGLGNAAAKVDKIADVESTVKKLQGTPGPSCINLVVDQKPIHPVTAIMVSVTDDPDTIVVPYYDNLPRPRYKN